jgi:hypothetical protein
MKCDTCGAAIPPQAAADAMINVPFMLVGADNVAAWVEAKRRAAVRTL